MPVLINFKICDNAKECNGIEVCPTGALSWNDEEETIEIDNSKCVECGKCEEACLVDAIKVAENEEEYKEIKQEIEGDPRKISDLFVDRYGAEPIEKAFIIPEGDFELEVLQSSKLTAVEFFNGESIHCLRYSIPIKDLFEGIDLKYRRQEIREENQKLRERFGVEELPSLLFFRDGELLGKIEGYHDRQEKEEMKEKIRKIVSE